MIEVEYHEIEFTCWECNKANMDSSVIQLQPVTRIQAVLNPDTKQKIGIYVQHKINFFSCKGPILTCAAEHVYISPALFSYCFSQLKELLGKAHERFTEKLMERSSKEDISFTLDYCISDNEVEKVMQQLKC